MTRGQTGKWVKRLGGETTRGEMESGRNDSGRTGKWAKRPGFFSFRPANFDSEILYYFDFYWTLYRILEQNFKEI